MRSEAVFPPKRATSPAARVENRGRVGFWGNGMTGKAFGFRSAAAGVALLLPALGPVTAEAQSIPCGEIYVVQPGDTLSEIAGRAYVNQSYLTILDANRDVVSSPRALEVSVRLYIPCIDENGNPLPRGVVPEQAVEAGEAPATPDEETAALAPAETTDSPLFQPAPGPLPDIPEGATVGLFVLANAKPYAGETLPEGGMITELVSRALLRAPVRLQWEIDFGDNPVNEPADIVAGGADLGYPAGRPDCGDAGALSASEAALCEDFLFSDPIYDFAMGTFVSALGDFTEATEPEDIYGTRFCRPEGASSTGLAAAGLVAPNINPVAAKSVDECFLMLVNGDVSVVNVPVSEGLAAANQLGVDGKVVQLPIAAGSSPMHVVSPRSNPLSAAYIDLINRGLADMRASGEYEAVVQNHLSFAQLN